MEFVVEGPGVGALADAVHSVMQQGGNHDIRFIEYGEPTAGTSAVSQSALD